MLRKIISIENVGRFRNSASTPNPGFAKYTLIFGANGFGKTTICAILRSLESGEAFHIAARRTLGAKEEPAAEFLFDDGNAAFRTGAWTKRVRGMSIFDSTFIHANVHSGDVVDVEHRRGLYRVIIGREGVAFAIEEERLAEDSRSKAGEIRYAEATLTGMMPTGMKTGEFLKLQADPRIDQKIADAQRTLDATKEASHIKTRGGLTEVVIPALSARLETLLATSLDGIAADAEAKIARHLSEHGMTGQAWLVEGVGYIADENCPFCGQSLGGRQLVRAYEAVFGTAYKSLKADVATIRVETDDAFGARAVGGLEKAIEQNRGSVEFWGRYCTLDTSGLTPPVDAGARFRQLHEAIIALLDRKASAPLDAVRLDEAPAGVLDAYQKSRDALEAHNAAVRIANGIIEAKRAQIGTADEKAIEEQLTRLRAIKRRHENQAEAACATYMQLREEKEQIEAAKSAVRATLNSHTEKVVKPYEARINEYLARFNAGFRIAQTKHAYAGGHQASSSYQIVINNTAVELGDGKTAAVKPRFATTLSAGDRSTLALAFFLAHLDHDSELAERILVFDDPFTSQDSFRRRWTVQEIKRKGAASAQVIVLSHDASFLRQMWDKCPPDQRAALQIVDQGDHGCKIVAFDLADACKGRAASELDDLIAYHAGGAAKPRDVIKKIRIVLETYCRTAYHGQFTGEDNLGDMVGKIRTAGERHLAWALHDRLDVINDYSAQYHHGEDPADATSPDHIDETELKGFVRDTLRIANNLQA